MLEKKVLVIGLGITGFSVARYLAAKNQTFVMYDTRLSPPDLELFKQQFPKIEVYCQNYPEDLLSHTSKIIISPGVDKKSPIIEEALALNLPLENDLDCLAEELKNTKVVAITGSNGKSTVTSWVSEIATLAGLKVAVGGNLGTPVLDLLLEQDNYDLWVLELSSFQLANMRHLNITAGALLNVSPDHLDMHGSMENYIAAKQQMFKFARKGVYNREDEATYPKFQLEQSESFGLTAPVKDCEWGIIERNSQAYLAKGKDLWLPTNKLKLKGKHNWQNALATSALCDMIGMDKQIILDGLEHFSGLHHRTEWVSELNGVTFINDSKGTNLGATQAAIEGIGPTISGKIILIAGGLSKGADFTPMRACLNKYVKHVILIGKDALILKKCWDGAVLMSQANTLKDAVKQSVETSSTGDVILLSPACASFDMFKGYEDRGQQFVEIVKGLSTC
jgi:UDP-N-acetylmuramoylalanine--D-glutamate ligase